mgnify:CR=1 FL=1
MRPDPRSFSLSGCEFRPLCLPLNQAERTSPEFDFDRIALGRFVRSPVAVRTENGAFCDLFSNPLFLAPITHQLAYFRVFLPSISVVVVESGRIGLSTFGTPFHCLLLVYPLTKVGLPAPSPFGVPFHVPVVPPLVD